LALFGKPAPVPVPPPARAVLDLSGPHLRRALETLVTGAERDGGVERFIAGLVFKSAVFREALADGRAATLDGGSLLGLCAFMAPVRRRIGAWLAENDIETLRRPLLALLDGAADGSDAARVDARLAAFEAAFPRTGPFRWVRDFAAEVLHFTYPEIYPLMARWVWDRKANTGVLREIWYGDVDGARLDIADDYDVFLVLREELSQFLSDNGVFRDMVFYVDLICAQVYADYICSQGGAFLRADFSSEDDPMAYVRRMLGLDGVDPETGRSRVKGADGRPFVVGDPTLLN
jgi:hypothetical protein